ncbi:MAG: cell wall hydrolase, partial [Hyphomicrobiales bacterium]
MTKTARRQGGSIQRPQPVLRRAALVVGCSLAMVPALTSAVAFQDMTSLLEGDRAQTRWQAYFIPSPAGAVEKAEISFGAAARSRMPAGAGIRAGNGDLYTVNSRSPEAETPDETRVTRYQKEGRVLAITQQAPPKAFTAGSILERQSLLRPGAAVGAELRTAFIRQETR